MKRNFGIVIDSTCNISLKPDLFSDASVVPLSIMVDSETYVDGKLNNIELLNYIHNNKKVTTSQPSPDLFIKAYEQQFALGYEKVVCFVLSSGLSGTINSANLAKSIIGKDITIIDTKTAGPGVLYLLEKLDEYTKENNFKLENALSKLMLEQATTGSLFFSVFNLATLVKGGRLTRIQAMVGNLLRIKPILRFKDNVLSVEKKARGTQNIYNFFILQANKYLESNKKTIIKIVYVDENIMAKELYHELNMIKNPNMVVELYGPISPVIATHLGYRGIGIYINHENN